MNSYIWGVIAGAALAIILLVVLITVMGKNGAVLDGFSESSYDERQQRARVKAFKSGFFTLLIYNALYAALSAIAPRPCCDVPTGCFIGICLSVTVFAVVCIMNDAYFTLKNDPKKVLILFGAATVLNALPALAFLMDKDEGMLTDGALNFRCINLVMVLMFIVIFIALGVKRARDRREGE